MEHEPEEEARFSCLLQHETQREPKQQELSNGIHFKTRFMDNDHSVSSEIIQLNDTYNICKRGKYQIAPSGNELWTRCQSKCKSIPLGDKACDQTIIRHTVFGDVPNIMEDPKTSSNSAKRLRSAPHALNSPTNYFCEQFVAHLSEGF